MKAAFLLIIAGALMIESPVGMALVAAGIVCGLRGKRR